MSSISITGATNCVCVCNACRRPAGIAEPPDPFKLTIPFNVPNEIGLVKKQYEVFSTRSMSPMYTFLLCLLRVELVFCDSRLISFKMKRIPFRYFRTHSVLTSTLKVSCKEAICSFRVILEFSSTFSMCFSYRSAILMPRNPHLVTTPNLPLTHR